jgi:hypothetical protein
MIRQAHEDPTWGRAILRLVGRPGAGVELTRYLREDLAAGQRQGRFETGPDDATLDLIGGLVILTIRRIVEGRARPDAAERAVERGLRALGLAPDEATAIAVEAVGSGASSDEVA